MKGVSTKRIREEHGLTQKEFAEKFQFSLRTVQNWESRNCCPMNVMRLISFCFNYEKTYTEALERTKKEYEKQIEFYQNMLGV